MLFEENNESFLVCLPHRKNFKGPFFDRFLSLLTKMSKPFCKVLDQSLPLLDPAFYIYRFAHKLGFSKQSKDVTDTANRIVSRMKRDWMVIGRRPAGICGAAFVMAARIHGFKETTAWEILFSFFSRFLVEYFFLI